MNGIDTVLRVSERIIPYPDDPCTAYVCNVSLAIILCTKTVTVSMITDFHFRVIVSFMQLLKLVQMMLHCVQMESLPTNFLENAVLDAVSIIVVQKMYRNNVTCS